MFICLHIIYGSFYTRMTEFSSCNINHKALKPKIFPISSFTEKACLPLFFSVIISAEECSQLGHTSELLRSSLRDVSPATLKEEGRRI